MEQQEGTGLRARAPFFIKKYHDLWVRPAGAIH
nr:MAG TPA: hypothetical protein [Caudoviricetes sp.]